MEVEVFLNRVDRYLTYYEKFELQTVEEVKACLKVYDDSLTQVVKEMKHNALYGVCYELLYSHIERNPTFFYQIELNRQEGFDYGNLVRINEKAKKQ